MNATANIIVKEQEDILTLPIQCVTMRNVEMIKKMEAGEDVSEVRKGGKDALKEVVFAYDDGTVNMTEVKTGISSDTEIEIMEGLEEGKEVVCGPYKTLHRELKDKQNVEIAKPGEMKKGEKEK
jgi:HlyD family secretion protein